MIIMPPVTLQANWHYEQISAEVTTYTSSVADCGKSDGVTTSGTIAHYGTLAAPSSFNFGTLIDIDGQIFTVEDRGSAIVTKDDGTHVFDMWLPDSEQCINYGRQKKKCLKIVKHEEKIYSVK